MVFWWVLVYGAVLVCVFFIAAHALAGDHIQCLVWCVMLTLNAMVVGDGWADEARELVRLRGAK